VWALFSGGVGGTEVLEVTRRVLLGVLDAAEGCALFAVGVGGGGGYTLCASLYAGGCGVWALFVGGVGGTELLR